MKSLAKAGKLAVAALPVVGAGVGHASAAHAAATGDYTGAALDEAGNIPVAGDLLDAGRAGVALGTALDEATGYSEFTAAEGREWEAAARELGAGETLSTVAGVTGTLVNTVPLVHVVNRGYNWLFGN